MAKAIIEFNLSDQEDLSLFNRMNKSTDMANALWNILHNTKKELEREVESDENKYKESPYEVIDLIYSKIWQIVSEESNIDIDNIFS